MREIIIVTRKTFSYYRASSVDVATVKLSYKLKQKTTAKTVNWMRGRPHWSPTTFHYNERKSETNFAMNFCVRCSCQPWVCLGSSEWINFAFLASFLCANCVNFSQAHFTLQILVRLLLWFIQSVALDKPWSCYCHSSVHPLCSKILHSLVERTAKFFPLYLAFSLNANSVSKWII